MMILWMSTINAGVENEGCEKLLDKCAVVVEKQKNAIDEQRDVIDSQRKLTNHLQKVSEVQEKEIKETRSWLFGSNIFLLLLMLL